MEVECSVFWVSVDVKQMEFISRAIFRVLGTLDIGFVYVNTSVQYVRLTKKNYFILYNQ